MRVSFTGLDKRRLRRWLTGFFVALAVPTGILIYQAYSQLKWEAFHQHQLLAEELAARVDERLIQLINGEEARAFTDYAFLVVAGDPAASFLRPSVLSVFPVASDLPGLIGYFQVDAAGGFSTPLLPQAGVDPTAYGISRQELEQRSALVESIRQILTDNRLVQGVGARTPGRKAALDAARQRRESQRDMPEQPQVSGFASGDDADDAQPAAGGMPARDSSGSKRAEEVLSQAAFDRLNAPPSRSDEKKKQVAAGKLGRVEDLKLDYRYQDAPVSELEELSVQQKSAAPEKLARKERSALPELPQPAMPPLESDVPTEVAAEKSQLNISILESEIDPFEFSVLDSGHFVLFRRVWRDGERYIQGSLLEPELFLQGVIGAAFREASLSDMSDLIIAYQGEVISAYRGHVSRAYMSSAEELSGTLLYQTRLSTPLSDVELIFSITRLPPGPGAVVVNWVAFILLLVLCAGFYLMYRLGVQQIDLARQQQDFVSAVSHELKTPLTSIRMYGEMLREGWAPEEKKNTYYDYIFDESERLSRLISNVLQLARMNRNELHIELKSIAVAELVDSIRAKVSSHIERAGFELTLNCDGETGRALVAVDSDCFAQIVINLVDNAIKFSAQADIKAIDIGCLTQRDGSVMFSVRDYGPGVPRDQMRKIFKLFYRSENELSRETVGTGIGLALVQQLVMAMDGRVDVVNAEPGAEFRVWFPGAQAIQG
ncbi:sensor histidine kinase [Thiogranum longum]